MRLIDADWLEDLLLAHEHNARAFEASGKKVSFTYADGIRTAYADVGLCPTIKQAEQPSWVSCELPPPNGRNVFLAHGTEDFKACCIGHYEHDMKQWYEDKNWFATPIYDCKYWCDIPDLPYMGDKQFSMPEVEE